jgi:hypothetical protein
MAMQLQTATQFHRSVTCTKGDLMFSTGRLATRTILAASLAGLVMLTAAPAMAAAGPAAGSAATVRPAGNGSFKTWKNAQKAAGFKLKAATRTFGLKRTRPILVGTCEVHGKTTKHSVYAEWHGRKSTFMAVDQNNSGGACGNIGEAKSLGTRRIQGHKAHLFGYCGMKGEPSCAKKNISLVLAWKAGKDYYVTFSKNEWRSTLANFSRSLRRV